MADELLSPEAARVAVAEFNKAMRQMQADTPKSKAGGSHALAAKERELEQLRGMLKSGAQSPTVAQAAIGKTEEELRGLAASSSGETQKAAAKGATIIPRAAEDYREAIARLADLMWT